MRRRIRRSFLIIVTVLALAPVSGAAAAEPPWCGTPEPDASANLDPNAQGAFPHIPHYAIGCTLEDIASRSDGRMRVRTVGQSALGRGMYGVVINELRTRGQRRAYRHWLSVRRIALADPARAQRVLAGFGDDVKVPVFIQGGIHGDEYEGVDAAIDVIERLALTPPGDDPFVDDVRDHAVVIFNPIQNPDGRVAGVRQNGNGFDLNRDYLTQSQSETIASISLMRRWLPPEVLDLHGYVAPTLIEATTKPHNPSIEYDLWLKWNQPRIDANEAAVNAIGRSVQRPINDWCADTSIPPPGQNCPDGRPPGPAVAEGWDDWGPFYTAMYAQHLGLDASTVEMCDPTLNSEGQPEDPECRGRAGSRDVQIAVQESTLRFVAAHRAAMLHDELEGYRRGDTDAPRPACCPPPFDVDNNWMHDYPKAYVIPVGEGQRSDAEATRLVRWLLFNDIEVSRLRRDARFGGQTFERGSYVVWMAQPRRGLADTALGIGVDISDRISILYAPPAAWSHGYLWGADTVTIPDGAAFSASTYRIHRPSRLKGSLPHGRVAGYTLQVDSPTAVRALNRLIRDGAGASIATESFSGGPAGTVVFAGDRETRAALKDAARRDGLDFGRLGSGSPPALEPIERVPRFRVISSLSSARVDQSVWVLRQLGFDADPTSTGQLGSAATDPLAGYDMLYNAASGSPGNAAAQARIAAFFARGGGYIGGQLAGASFLANGGQAAGLAGSADSGNQSGYSGILLWDNTGGDSSVVTGAYPARDTYIADPPTWLTGVPGTWSVDGRLPATGFFAAGLWPGSGPANAGGAAVIVHGPNTGGTARLAVFASNPLYRADPEREWPMVATAAYWADGD